MVEIQMQPARRGIGWIKRIGMVRSIAEPTIGRTKIKYRQLRSPMTLDEAVQQTVSEVLVSAGSVFAGDVDTTGFMKLNGLFVSSMSEKSNDLQAAWSLLFICSRP